MDRLVSNKLNQIEENIKNYFDQNFDVIKDLIEESKNKKRTRTTDNEFHIDYFIEFESSDPDFILKDDEDASLLIDGILEHKLDYENADSILNQKLKQFTTFDLCRFVITIIL
jgi:hypothetical protein